jgi:hypothetical protein
MPILGNSWMQLSLRNLDIERKKNNNDNKSVCMISMQLPCVPLTTEPGISVIILTPMKILQRNLKRGTFFV